MIWCLAHIRPLLTHILVFLFSFSHFLCRCLLRPQDIICSHWRKHKSPFSSSVSIPVLQEISSASSNEPSAPTTWWNRGQWLLHPSILCSTFHPDAQGVLYTNGRNMNAAQDNHCETQECEGDGWNCFIDLAVKVWAVLHHVLPRWWMRLRGPTPE